MKINAYILFNRDSGEIVPPLDSTGEPVGMFFDRLMDAEQSAKWHEEAYDVPCDIRPCTIEVHED